MSNLADQLKAAKQALNRAAADCMQNVAGAAERADQALAEVAAIQTVMKAARSRECAQPGCGRLTLQDRCDQHRPAEAAI